MEKNKIFFIVFVLIMLIGLVRVITAKPVNMENEETIHICTETGKIGACEIKPELPQDIKDELKNIVEGVK